MKEGYTKGVKDEGKEGKMTGSRTWMGNEGEGERMTRRMETKEGNGREVL